MKNVVLLLMTLSLFSIAAEARKKKFKGVIIVNQILKSAGTMTDNGTPAPEFSGVKEGDVLETAPASFAMVRIPGLGIFRLGAATKIKLTKFYNRDTSKFELFKGELLSVYKRLGQHEVKLPGATVYPNGNSNSNTFVTVAGEKNLVGVWDGKLVIKAANALPADTAAPQPALLTNPTPSKTPELKSDPNAPPAVATRSEITVASKDTYKKVVVGSQGLEEKEESAVSLPDIKIIQEMESLYSLP